MLIDNETEEVLTSSSSAHQGLSAAATYIQEENVAYHEVTYVIKPVTGNTKAAFRVSGSSLAELIQDEGVEYEDEDDLEVDN